MLAGRAVTVFETGDFAAGHAVTALFEIVPQGANEPGVTENLLTIKLRYQRPHVEQSESIERSLGDWSREFRDAPVDFKFAAAVAEFGMILRDSPHKGEGTLGAVVAWANDGKGLDRAGTRAGFVELVEKARRLTKG